MAYAEESATDNLIKTTQASICSCYYKNMPIQISWKFSTKKWKFSDKNFDVFHISAQNIENIDCGYWLELPHWGSSNEYPQSVFEQK